MSNQKKSKNKSKPTSSSRIQISDDDEDNQTLIRSTIDKIISANSNDNSTTTTGNNQKKNKGGNELRKNKNKVVLDKEAYQEKVNQTMNEIMTGIGESITKFSKIEDDIKEVLELSNELCQTRKLHSKLNEELNKLNNSSKYESRASLISNLEKESRLIKKLETENKELETAINFQNQVLSLTMKKFRQQKIDLQKIKEMEMDDKKFDNSLLEDRYKYFRTVHDQLVPVLESGCLLEEAQIEKNEKIISLLKQGIADLQKKLLIKK